MDARIFEIFSSSCSSQGLGTRKSRWRSSPGTTPWRSSASTIFSGTSSQSGLICRPSKSTSTSLQGPSRSAIDLLVLEPGVHQRVPLEVVRATSARSAAPAGAARSARSSCSARCAVESGCLVPVRRRTSGRGFSRKRRRAAANARGSRSVERRVALSGAGAFPDPSSIGGLRRALGCRRARHRDALAARSARARDP